MINKRDFWYHMVKMSKGTDSEITMTQTEKVMRWFDKALRELLPEDELKIATGISQLSVYKEPHEARNPMTGETFMTKGKYRVKAKLSPSVVDAANKIAHEEDEEE